jgi:hypothetical protein
MINVISQIRPRCDCHDCTQARAEERRFNQGLGQGLGTTISPPSHGVPCMCADCRTAIPHRSP